MCSLRFENYLLSIEDVRFASISKRTPLSKLWLAFVAITMLMYWCESYQDYDSSESANVFSNFLLVMSNTGQIGNLFHLKTVSVTHVNSLVQ
jgi:hypothetical protein